MAKNKILYVILPIILLLGIYGNQISYEKSGYFEPFTIKKTNSIMTMSLDNSTYEQGQIINVLGKVNDYTQGVSVNIQVIDPTKKVVDNFHAMVNRFGIFAEFFAIPDTFPSGKYILTGYYEGDSNKTPLSFDIVINNIPHGEARILIPPMAASEENNLNFIPSKVTATLGTKITFVNNDATIHTAISGRVTPNGTFSLDSKFTGGYIQPGGQLSITPKAGNYTYFCKIHPWLEGAFSIKAPPVPQPATSAKPATPAVPTKTVTSTKNTTSTTAKPVTPTKPVTPAKNTTSTTAKPATPAKPVTPAVPTKTVTSTKNTTSTTAKPVTPTKPVTPAKNTTSTTAKPATPPVPAKPVTPTKNVTSTVSAKAAVPTKPVTPVAEKSVPSTDSNQSAGSDDFLSNIWKAITGLFKWHGTSVSDNNTASQSPIVTSVVPAKPAAPVTEKVVTPAVPAKPVIPSKNTTSTTPAKPVTHAKPTTPVVPAKPFTPAIPVKPMPTNFT